MDGGTNHWLRFAEENGKLIENKYPHLITGRLTADTVNIDSRSAKPCTYILQRLKFTFKFYCFKEREVNFIASNINRIFCSQKRKIRKLSRNYVDSFSKKIKYDKKAATSRTEICT